MPVTAHTSDVSPRCLRGDRSRLIQPGRQVWIRRCARLGPGVEHGLPLSGHPPSPTDVS